MSEQFAAPKCIEKIKETLDPHQGHSTKPTPGEWVVDGHEGWAYPNIEVVTESGGRSIMRVRADFTCTIGKAEYEWANATFVAACSPQNIREVIGYIAELERQLAEAQKDQADAKRYRWLSAQYIPARAILDYRTAWIVNVESHLPMGDTFDQAIDAAMSDKVKT